jgi:hypothetical protein
MDMISIQECLEDIPYNHISMMIALDEITYGIWTMDRPIDIIVQWMKDHPWHSYPKRKHRWIKLLDSQFKDVIVTVPEHYIIRVRDQLLVGIIFEPLRILYRHILDNARLRSNGTYTVLIHCSSSNLLDEMIYRKIVTTGLYNNSVRINRFK